MGLHSPEGGLDKDDPQVIQASDQEDRESGGAEPRYPREDNEENETYREAQEKEDPLGKGSTGEGKDRSLSGRRPPGGSGCPDRRSGKGRSYQRESTSDSEEELLEGETKDAPGRALSRSTGHLTRKVAAPGAQPVEWGSSRESSSSPSDQEETGRGGPDGSRDVPARGASAVPIPRPIQRGIQPNP